MFRVSGIELGDVGNGTDRKNQEPPKRPPRPNVFESPIKTGIVPLTHPAIILCVRFRADI
jgi:hypothetical protein